MAPTYTLYTYYRSSCSARVRIASYLKGIDLEYKFIHLLKDDHHSNDYAQINPSELVPTLVVAEDGKVIATIRQSIAILEYFEESRNDLPPLFPTTSDPVGRAKVRELVNIVACDIQPVTNLRIIQRIKPAGLDPQDWQKSFTTLGLLAYERLASLYAGKFSVGDEITLADCVLTPAVDNAIRFGVDMTQFPVINRITQNLETVEAFRKGGWRAQPDTPEEFRNSSA